MGQEKSRESAEQGSTKRLTKLEDILQRLSARSPFHQLFEEHLRAGIEDIYGEVRNPSDTRWPKLRRARFLEDYNVSLVRVSKIRDLLKGFDKTAMGAGTKEDLRLRLLALVAYLEPPMKGTPEGTPEDVANRDALMFNLIDPGDRTEDRKKKMDKALTYFVQDRPNGFENLMRPAMTYAFNQWATRREKEAINERMNGLIKKMQVSAQSYDRNMPTGARAWFPHNLGLNTFHVQTLSLTHLGSITWRTSWSDQPNAYPSFTMGLILSADCTPTGYPGHCIRKIPVSMNVATVDLSAPIWGPGPPPLPANVLPPPDLVALMSPLDTRPYGLFRPIHHEDEAVQLLKTWEEELVKQQKRQRPSLGILPLVTNPPHGQQSPRTRFFVTVNV